MEKQNLNRGQFLKSLGLSSASLMAFYCMGTLTSCSNDSDPAPNNNNNSGGGNNQKIDFTLDLTSNDFKNLKTEGEFAYKDNIIIANAKGTMVALAKACTHAGTTVVYRKATDDMHCSNHGSNFGTTGAVKNGPATAALKVYKTELLDNGNKLRVTE